MLFSGDRKATAWKEKGGFEERISGCIVPGAHLLQRQGVINVRHLWSRLSLPCLTNPAARPPTAKRAEQIVKPLHTGTGVGEGEKRKNIQDKPVPRAGVGRVLHVQTSKQDSSSTKRRKIQSSHIKREVK